MLIHGAIIAREMGIPCVNGVARAVEQLRDAAGEHREWESALGFRTTSGLALGCIA